MCSIIILQCVDDGHGIVKENFQGLTKKYCTSKISEFRDLEGVETFGFRGEGILHSFE